MSSTDSSLTVHAPGSVTTIFAPPIESQEQDQDGSFGVSFAIEDGVTATIEPSSDSTVVLDGDSAPLPR